MHSERIYLQMSRIRSSRSPGSDTPNASFTRSHQKFAFLPHKISPEANSSDVDEIMEEHEYEYTRYPNPYMGAGSAARHE